MTSTQVERWMTRGRFAGAVAVAICLGSALPAAIAQDQVEAPIQAGRASPWIQKVESQSGAVVELRVAVREYMHVDPTRPRITIAGAVHIGEPEFYEQLHEVLDPLDVVLYEGVQSRKGGAGNVAADERTRNTMLLLGLRVEKYRDAKGMYPESIDQMRELWPEIELLKAPVDGWGGELVYTRHEVADANGDQWEMTSLGADGKEGGIGANEDVRWNPEMLREAMLETASPSRRRARPEGMQKQLADAMGLVFQLEVMDHTAANWRNSDISMEELRDRFRAEGVEADGLMGMLSGSSMMARFSGMLLSMLSATEQSRAMLKAMMIEMLGDADRLMQQMPGGMGAMMRIIVDERNEIVLDDVERIVREEPDVRTLGIIYGAGHLPHMEHRLTADFGYEPAGERWLTAMIVDAGAAGVPPSQLRQLRQMIRRSMEAQLQRPRRQR